MPRWLLVAAALLVGGGLGASIVGQEQQKQAATTTAVELAAPLAAVCATDPGVAAGAGADCQKAQTVAREQAVTTVAGPRGEPGIGVVSITVTEAGRLQVVYSNGRVVDAGQVRGADGVSISAAGLNGDRLVLTYTDGRTTDLGPVVGDRGRGIAEVAAVEGRLVITYDDGTIQDAGPLPAGPPGAAGAAGPAGPAGPVCQDGYQPVDAGPVTGADGTRYSRSTVCVDPASAESR